MKKKCRRRRKSEIGFFVGRLSTRIFYLTCLIVFQSKLIDVVKTQSVPSSCCVRVTQHRCEMRFKVQHLCKQQIDTFENSPHSISVLLLSGAPSSTNKTTLLNEVCMRQSVTRNFLNSIMNSKVIDRHRTAFHECEFYFESPLLHNHQVCSFRIQ